jgi:hypothetical protein
LPVRKKSISYMTKAFLHLSLPHPLRLLKNVIPFKPTITLNGNTPANSKATRVPTASETTSPTVATDALMCTLLINANEQWEHT